MVEFDCPGWPKWSWSCASVCTLLHGHKKAVILFGRVDERRYYLVVITSWVQVRSRYDAFWTNQITGMDAQNVMLTGV